MGREQSAREAAKEAAEFTAPTETNEDVEIQKVKLPESRKQKDLKDPFRHDFRGEYGSLEDVLRAEYPGHEIQIEEKNYGVGYPGYNKKAKVVSEEVEGCILYVSYPMVNSPTIRGHISLTAKEFGGAKELFKQLKGMSD